LRCHLRHEDLGEEERRFEVDSEHPTPSINVEFVPGNRVVDCGIVYQYVRVIEPVRDLFGKRRHLRPVGDIGPDGQPRASGRTDQIAGVLLLSQVDANDLITAPGQRRTQRLPDALRCSGHHRGSTHGIGGAG
jgi:hypothetical protein